jgi:hypothetical protein
LLGLLFDLKTEAMHSNKMVVNFSLQGSTSLKTALFEFSYVSCKMEEEENHTLYSSTDGQKKKKTLLMKRLILKVVKCS